MGSGIGVEAAVAVAEGVRVGVDVSVAVEVGEAVGVCVNVGKFLAMRPACGCGAGVVGTDVLVSVGEGMGGRLAC